MKTPDYYSSYGFECDSLIRLIDGRFNIGNVVKYLYRMGMKTESMKGDARKAVHYLEKEMGDPEEHECTFSRFSIAKDYIKDSSMPDWKRELFLILIEYCYHENVQTLIRIKRGLKGIEGKTETHR